MPQSNEEVTKEKQAKRVLTWTELKLSVMTDFTFLYEKYLFDLLLALKQVRSPATQGTAYAVVRYISTFSEEKVLIMRVRSWLRMNAGGVPNTCKSNEMRIGKLRPEDMLSSGGRVSNTWVTCLMEGDNREKSLLIPHKHTVPHGTG